MAHWTNSELDAMGDANLMVLDTAQPDGTPRKPIIVWAVRVGDEVFLRSVRGTDGSWYRAIQAQPVGRIQSGGVDRAVRFEPVAEAPAAAIDVAYRTKYGRGSAVDSITSPAAQATTVRLTPQSEA